MCLGSSTATWRSVDSGVFFDKLSVAGESVERLNTKRFNPLKLYIAAFLVELVDDLFDALSGQACGAAKHVRGDFAGIEYLDAGDLGTAFDPPSWERENRFDPNFFSCCTAEVAAEPFRVGDDLVEAVSVLFGMGETERVAIVDNDVIGLAFLRPAFATGLGFDGVHARGSDNDVVDIPFRVGWEIVEDVTAVAQ